MFKKQLKVNNSIISLNLRIEKGVISDIEIGGDIFTNEEINIFKHSFLGALHRKTEIKKVIQAESCKEILIKLSEENILELFF